MAKPDMRTQLETTFARIKSEREAKAATELAADSVPTDNVTVLRERATRHAHRAVDEYWGYFNDIQTALDQRVITPLLEAVARIAGERDEQTRYAARLEAEICQCEPQCEEGEYLHTADCPVVPIQMREYGCPGFEGNPVAPDSCAGCHEPRDSHAEAVS
jgi:hypothetical protein